MKQLLLRLHQGETLSREEAKDALLRITEGGVNSSQLASFITVFAMRAITVEELQGFQDALLMRCLPMDLQGIESIDIVGTGGDGKDTFNISTLSCFVVAAAGYKVTKHGSYGSSSISGSSNTLENLGYRFTADTDVLKRQLDTCNLCFLHAPAFHPAMKSVVQVRRELGFRTFFNLLGPLVNPCRPTHQLFGTSAIWISDLYEQVMRQSGRQFCIVHALDGYDEVSLTGNFDLRENEGDRMLSPRDIKKPTLSPKDLYGGSTQAEAAKILVDVLQGNGTAAQAHVVTANAGLAIHCLRPKQPIEVCIAEAEEALNSGKALDVFKRILN
jgi:anthranilate phosphoribosyltransferase